MSDYRNLDSDYRDPQDLDRRDAKLDPDARATNVMWGWVIGAVFVLAALAVVFGASHQPAGTNTASNNVTPPATNRMAPPTPMPTPSMAPTPATPIAPAPSTPAPNPPGQATGH
jgi:hypothetical protein